MRGGVIRRIFAALLLVLTASSIAHAAVIQLVGTINDEAGVVSFRQATLLKDRIDSYRQRTGNQIAILTIKDDDGLGTREYSRRVFTNWRISKRSGRQVALITLNSRRGDGAVNYVARDGMPALNLRQAGRVLSERDTSPAQRLERALDVTVARMDTVDKTPPPTPAVPIKILAYMSLLLIPLFPWLGAVLSRAQSHIWGGGIVALMMSASLTALLGLKPGAVIALILISLGVFLDYLIKAAYREANRTARPIPRWAGGNWNRPADQEDMPPKKGVDMEDI